MDPTPKPRFLPVAVGLYALWQMVFLVADNVVDMVPRRLVDETEQTPVPLEPLQKVGTVTSVEPVQRAVEAFGWVVNRYAEATGQKQGWSLFAPGFPPQSLFGAVELRFADGPAVEIRSAFEPAEGTYGSQLRPPLINVRRQHYEGFAIGPVWHHTPEAMREQPEAVNADTLRHVREGNSAIRTLLRWKADAYARAHPDRGPPTEVVLKARYIPTPLPHEPPVWAKPAWERPVARWRPAAPPAADELPVQAFDVVKGRWVSLLTAGGER